MNTTQINGLKDFEPALFTGHSPEVCHYCERAQVVA